MVFFSYGAYFSFLTFLPSFLVAALGASPAVAGTITSLITAGTIVSWPGAGWLSDRYGRRKPMTIVGQLGSALACVFFALAAPQRGLWSAAAAALTTGLVVGGMILPFVMVVELFPPQLAATAAGVTNTSCFVGGMVLPIVLGRMVDVTGGFTAAFLLAAVLQGLALVCCFVMVETGPAARAGGDQRPR
jgi:NNP family nitrate/nitrite transporter-like MFS transporter